MSRLKYKTALIGIDTCEIVVEEPRLTPIEEQLCKKETLDWLRDGKPLDEIVVEAIAEHFGSKFTDFDHVVRNGTYRLLFLHKFNDTNASGDPIVRATYHVKSKRFLKPKGYKKHD